MSDLARGMDNLAVSAAAAVLDGGRATTHWLVERFDADQTAWVSRRSGVAVPQRSHFAQLGVVPYGATELVGNLITNAGWNLLMSLATGQGGQAMDATHTRIGVGNGVTAEAYTDTDLAGAGKWFQPVSGAAVLGTRTMQFGTAFGPDHANFVWSEFGLDVTTAAAVAGDTVSGLLFNRKSPISQGEKAQGQTWTTTATVTFS